MLAIEVSAIAISFLAFAYAVWLYLWVKRQPSENKRIIQVGKWIQDGARTFLRREYKVLARFAAVAAVLILVFLPAPIWKGNVIANITMAIAYLFGTAFSALAGKIGVEVATISNGKAAEAAKKGIQPSFMTGFRGGAVMGMAVVGFSLLGVTLVFMITGDASALLDSIF